MGYRTYKRSDNNTSELISEVNKLTTQNQKLEKLCRKLNKKLRAAEKSLNESKNNPVGMSNSKSTPILDLDRDGGASVSGSIMSNDDSVSAWLNTNHKVKLTFHHQQGFFKISQCFLGLLSYLGISLVIRYSTLETCKIVKVSRFTTFT